MTVEHFPTRASRRDSLVQRVDTFFPAAGWTPEAIVDDEQRLVTLLAALLGCPAVTLAEAVLDPDSGTYRPAGRALAVR